MLIIGVENLVPYGTGRRRLKNIALKSWESLKASKNNVLLLILWTGKRALKDFALCLKVKNPQPKQIHQFL